MLSLKMHPGVANQDHGAHLGIHFAYEQPPSLIQRVSELANRFSDRPLGHVHLRSRDNHRTLVLVPTNQNASEEDLKQLGAYIAEGLRMQPNFHNGHHGTFPDSDVIIALLAPFDNNPSDWEID